jgi:hypothetical protein
MKRRQQAEDEEKAACRGWGEGSRQRMEESQQAEDAEKTTSRRQQSKDAEKTANKGCGEDSRTQGCGGRGDDSEMAGWWIRQEKRWQYEEVLTL